ncbi:MAG TPA: hypothetical protein VFB83_05080 [Propionibacteriaceae bacterium]|nr:hypothetical protein [Propionibacteriaceae bacterium]
MLFDERRREWGPLLVVWRQRDSFDGEDEPPMPFGWPWCATRATALTPLGQRQPGEVRGGRMLLEVSLTPIFVAAD